MSMRVREGCVGRTGVDTNHVTIHGGTKQTITVSCRGVII